MARGLLERPILFTHKNTLSLKTLSLCCDAALWMRACTCVCVCATALLTFSHPPLCLFHTHANTYTHSFFFLLEDANIAHDKAPVDSSQTKHFPSKAVHLYAEPIQRNAKVSWKAGFSPALSHSWRLFSLTSLVWPLITLMFEDIRLVVNCSFWYWKQLPV